MGQTNNTVKVRDFFHEGYIEIPEFELQEIRTAQQQLKIFGDIDELFAVAHETYIELEEELCRRIILDTTKPYTDFRTRTSDSKIRVNIRLLAMLTAVKCYTDQTKLLVKQLLPIEDEGAKFLGEAIAKIRDESLDFRTMELVRNSAQHHALPISFTSTNIKNDPDGLFPSQEVAQGFFLSRTALVEMKPQKRRDQETKCELLSKDFLRFDLVLLTRSYLQSICQLNKELSDFTLGLFNSAVQKLEDLHKDLRAKFCTDDVNPIVGDFEHLPSSQGIDFLRTRHMQASRRYASKQSVRLTFFPADEKTYPQF